MLSSIDGGLHPSRYTASDQGDRKTWSAAYERVHDGLQGDGWMVGRVTMAEMSKVEAHPPVAPGSVERPIHNARPSKRYAVAIDRAGKLHFEKGDIDGDQIIVLLGGDVADDHLAELAADGVSYIVADGPEIDLSVVLDMLGTEFGIRRLLLEGGGHVNGSLIAAGLVDELSLLVAPALDGDKSVSGVVAFPGGLAGRVRLALLAADPLDNGIVHLRYRITPEH